MPPFTSGHIRSAREAQFTRNGASANCVLMCSLVQELRGAGGSGGVDDRCGRATTCPFHCYRHSQRSNKPVRRPGTSAGKPAAKTIPTADEKRMRSAPGKTTSMRPTNTARSEKANKYRAAFSTGRSGQLKTSQKERPLRSNAETQRGIVSTVPLNEFMKGQATSIAVATNKCFHFFIPPALH